MKTSFDVVIVGAGLVGAALAIALAKASLQVALIEEATFNQADGRKESNRTIVLSYSSRVILDSLGIWSQLSAKATAIQEVHVSDQGSFGSVRISANEQQLISLGYVLSARTLQMALQEILTNLPNLTLLQPAKFLSYYYSDQVNMKIFHHNREQIFTAKLLVGADGYKSAIRSFQDIKVQQHDYQQEAIVCQVTLKRPHNGIAYERFTPEGPLAMLPLAQHHSAVIWTVTKSRAQQLLRCTASEFCQQLQRYFGYRMGKIMTCSTRVNIALTLTLAMQQIRPGMVLVGNAVHTLHPVGGQGLNLALQDIASLAEEIITCYQQELPFDFTMLQRYLAQRQAEQRKIITLTHSLIGIFSNSLLPVMLARDAGMIMLDRLPVLKKMLAHRMLGLAGKVPRLACGLALE